MTESIHAYVLDKLQEFKYRWPLVSTETGISIRTIGKIARKEVANPGVLTIEKLATYFRGHKPGVRADA